jgi:hypothetical protein
MFHSRLQGLPGERIVEEPLVVVTRQPRNHSVESRFPAVRTSTSFILTTSCAGLPSFHRFLNESNPTQWIFRILRTTVLRNQHVRRLDAELSSRFEVDRAVIDEKVHIDLSDILPPRWNLVPRVGLRKPIRQTKRKHFIHIGRLLTDQRQSTNRGRRLARSSRQPGRICHPTIVAPWMMGTPSVSSRSNAMRRREVSAAQRNDATPRIVLVAAATLG